MATKKVKTSFTNTKGEKIVVYTDGTKTVNGKSSSSSSSSSSKTSSSSKSSSKSSPKSTIDIIYDPVTKKYFSRDTAVKGSTYQPYTPKTDPAVLESLGKNVEETVSNVVKSGKKVNPGLTEDDLKAIDFKTFLKEAENSISDEFKGKFAAVEQNLLRDLGNLGVDLTRFTDKTNKEAKDSLISGAETLAGRGLAFSSTQNQFQTDVEDARSLALKEEEDRVARLGQGLLSGAEEKIGTDAVKDINRRPKIGGTSLEFSDTPLVGSLVSEKQYTKEAIAKQLATQEAQRRAYATRSLSFQ